MSNISVSSVLAEINGGATNKPTNLLPLRQTPVIVPGKRRAGRPAGSKNKPKPDKTDNVTALPGRPPGSPIDPRLSDPKFVLEIRALQKKWRCKNIKQLLTLARQATKTRVKFDMTPERRERMFAMFADGRAPRYVAERMGCSPAHANNVKVEWLKSQRKSAA